MTLTNPSEIIFSATLTPHRSLGRRGFLLLMVLVAGLAFLAGLYFWSLGAWPVPIFVGLDVVAIWIAFRLNYRAARAYEEVEIGRDLLVIRKVSASGRAQEVRFNPRWVRLEVEGDAEDGVRRISVHTHDRRVAVGAFLNPHDRTTFAQALGAALAEARR